MKRTFSIQLMSILLGLAVTSRGLAEVDLRYSAACDRTEDLEIVAVGDILLHGGLQKYAMARSDRYRTLWQPVIPFFEKADLAYANLEGPVAPQIDVEGKIVAEDVGFKYDDVVYTSYPKFNYHPHLVKDILLSGIDVVSTANNHSLDRRAIGADRTIEQLRAVQLPFTGTRTQVEAANSHFEWHVVTEQKGRRIAWLACTYSTNGIKDRANQVLMCFTDTAKLLGMVQSLAQNPEIDAVIVTPHWGDEYQLAPNAQQTKLARQLIDAGATAVFGTHPHVIQPWEKHVTQDGREGFIIYSTGNFVSGQQQVERATSTMIKLTLTGEPQAKLKIRGVGHLPLFMTRKNGLQVQPVLDLTKAQPTSVEIWKNAFSERLRVKSLDDNSFVRLCQE